MNLSAEAFRLAAVEALCPTAALQSGTGFPTLAGARVCDSRQLRIDELDEKAWAPTLALYTPDSTAQQRGDYSGQDDLAATAMLDIVGELATLMRDKDETFVGPVEISGAIDDSQARIVLAAMMAQVRHRLFIDPVGRSLIKKVVKSVRKMDVQTLGVPELGLRFHRMNMRIEASIRDDDFSAANSTLPEPLASLAAALPEQSYAKAKLTELAGVFTQTAPVPLASIHVTTGPTGGTVEFGPTFED